MTLARGVLVFGRGKQDKQGREQLMNHPQNEWGMNCCHTCLDRFGSNMNSSMIMNAYLNGLIAGNGSLVVGVS